MSPPKKVFISIGEEEGISAQQSPSGCMAVETLTEQKAKYLMKMTVMIHCNFHNQSIQMS
jgi:hypothetical protein